MANEEQDKSAGQVAYETYVESMGVLGFELPSWGSLSVVEQHAWEDAASAAMEYCA